MVHFKHKTYTNASDKSPELLIAMIENYLVKGLDLEVILSYTKEDGELFLAARRKNDLINRMAFRNYTVGIGVQKKASEIKVRIGDPALVLGTGVFGAISGRQVLNGMWAIVDQYLE